MARSLASVRRAPSAGAPGIRRAGGGDGAVARRQFRARGRAGCSPAGAPADPGGMWNYVLRHRLLLRAIYARSTPDA
jgi:hypothetical protein